MFINNFTGRISVRLLILRFDLVFVLEYSFCTIVVFLCWLDLSLLWHVNSGCFRVFCLAFALPFLRSIKPSSFVEWFFVLDKLGHRDSGLSGFVIDSRVGTTRNFTIFYDREVMVHHDVMVFNVDHHRWLDTRCNWRANLELKITSLMIDWIFKHDTHVYPLGRYFLPFCIQDPHKCI